MSDFYDVCVYGHISRDLIKTSDDTPVVQPGGAALYAAATLAALGAKVKVVTRVAHADQDDLFATLHRLQVDTTNLPSPVTTTFENIYSDRGSRRAQRVRSVAAPFSNQDLDCAQAKWILLGPLCAMDIGVEFITAAVGKAAVALDIQGLVRLVEGKDVVLRARPGLRSGLSGVHMLKANRYEAHSLTGLHDPEKATRALRALGPREVIVTMGRQGSLISVGDQIHRIPSFTAPSHVDPTGCGDTYFAGYLFRRMCGDGPVEAGRFAALLASLKLAQRGPYLGSEQDIAAARDRLPY